MISQKWEFSDFVWSRLFVLILFAKGRYCLIRRISFSEMSEKNLSLKFEVEVIKKVELSSNRSATDLYQINEKQVRNWRYDKAKTNEILDIPGDTARKEDRKRLVGGRRCHFLDESSILNKI